MLGIEWKRLNETAERVIEIEKDLRLIGRALSELLQATRSISPKKAAERQALADTLKERFKGQ